jgi:hypothetical protein
MGANFCYESIARMAPWDFWAHPSSLDLSEADRELTVKGPDQAPPEAIQRIQLACMKACVALRDCDIDLPHRKPS